ncbi:MAG: MTAP family purine nucleoside phosphorylase [Candidatus Tectomicrobia bacterium]|uniref:MTAP family purine nucleoside phosphorylase n=1 Tax=Tectimicrobiota bacterium TaxID=2528274 RepID=A0A933GQ69_UNCTE|nr:MTAP family purine nucleoside phosphorylase [Candidatus Tectomicrobia bacterium]
MLVKLAVIARVGAHLLFQKEGLKESECSPKKTPYGLSVPIHIFEFQGISFALISRHGEKGYSISAPFVNDKANLWALKEAGVEKIISWTAPGAINESFYPGDLVIPHDILDETKFGPYTFFEGKGLGFIRQNPVFCPELRKVYREKLADSQFNCHSEGVYVATTGPRLETPSEIKKFALFGGDLVGMTLVPEVFLARELEMCYGSICYVVNFAEGVKNAPMKPGILFEGLLEDKDKPKVDAVEAAFPKIICGLIEDVYNTPRSCPCKDLMLRYKIRGDIQEDWHSWIG